MKQQQGCFQKLIIKLFIYFYCNYLLNFYSHPKRYTMENQSVQVASSQKMQSKNKSQSQISIEPKQRFGHKPSIIYRSQIDGLRSVAILPILQGYTSGGFGGVDVFFVISGFLVNSIIISELLKQKFSLSVFYERRVRRLFPAIFTVLVVSLIFGYILYSQKTQYQQLVKQETAAIGSIANIYFYYKKNDMGDGYFDDNTQTWPFLHFWSLAVEEQFYVMTPLILMIMIKFIKKSNFLICMLCYSIVTNMISFALSIMLTQQNQMFAFYLLPCRAWQLGLGGLIAILLHNETIQKLKKQQYIKQILDNHPFFSNQKKVTIVLQILGWMGLIIIFISFGIFNKQQDRFPGYKALLPCSGAAIFIASNFIRYESIYFKLNPIQKINSQRSINQQDYVPKRIVLTSALFLSLKPLVWIGQISYSLYLWHWPIWVFFKQFMGKSELSSANKVFCILLTFMIAHLSTNEIQSLVRNKKKVTTLNLWKGFIIVWIFLISLFIINIKTQIGGQNDQIKDFQLSILQNSSQSLYPKYDDEGYLLANPYKSLKASQITLQKFGIPDFTSNQFRLMVPGRNSDKKLSPYLKDILINYSQNEKKQNKRVCLAALGSSHTEQHIQTLRQLALQYNVSLAILAVSGRHLQFFMDNQQQFDTWRINQLKIMKPKIIFALEIWGNFIQDHEVKIKNSIAPLLQLETPPEFIALFGDNPNSGLGQKVVHQSLIPLLKKKYEYNGRSWQFMQNLIQKSLLRQIKTEQNVSKYITENFNSDIVKFYPNLHQFVQDSETGNIQFVGSEIDGKLIFRDSDHLTLYGSKRYKNYFQNKIFKKAKQLCN